MNCLASLCCVTYYVKLAHTLVSYFWYIERELGAVSYPVVPNAKENNAIQ